MLIILILAHLSVYSQSVSPNGNWLIPRDLNSYKPRWIAYELVYPVNHGILEGYMDAQPFQHYQTFVKSKHLGADITSLVPGDEDLGDTIYSIGRGKVILRWSSIIMIMHKTLNGYIVSQYRHCMETFVDEGQYVDKAQPIARI